MIPHDFYAPWSDEPRLHNRGEGRPYIEPSWQANAAGHQLPVLSTIGRGPKGNGIYVGNYQINDQEYGFDIYSDRTNEVIAHIGPIPTGQVTFSESQPENPGDFKFTIFTNELVDGQVQRVPHDVTVPQGERGFSMYLMDPPLTPPVDEVLTVPLGCIHTVDQDTPQMGDGNPTTPTTMDIRVGDCVIWSSVADVSSGGGGDIRSIETKAIVKTNESQPEMWSTIEFGLIMQIDETTRTAVIRRYNIIPVVPADLDQYIENKTEEEVNRLLQLKSFVFVESGIPECLDVRIDYYAPASVSYMSPDGGFVGYYNYGNDLQVAQVYGHVRFWVDDWKAFYYNDMLTQFDTIKRRIIFDIIPDQYWSFVGGNNVPIACNVLFDAVVDCNPIFHVGIGRTEGAASIEITAENGISVDDPRWDFFTPGVEQSFVVSFEVPIWTHGEITQ